MANWFTTCFPMQNLSEKVAGQKPNAKNVSIFRVIGCPDKLELSLDNGSKREDRNFNPTRVHKYLLINPQHFLPQLFSAFFF